MGAAGRHAGRDRPRARQDTVTTLDDVITYLEMLERPTGRRVPAPLDKLALMRAENCTVSFYRYIYDTVGRPWLWFERRLLDDCGAGRADRQTDDRDLRALRARGARRLLRARHRSAAPDQALLFRARSPTLSAAGSVPTCCRRQSTRLGRGRSTGSGCTPRHFDHPKALGVYQQAGFVVYDRRRVSFHDPRDSGILPQSDPR